MIAAAYGSVSDIEILWVIIALIGFVYSVVNINSGREDIRWLNANSIGNGRRTLARYQLTAESLRALIQVIFIVIGVLSFFVPDPTDALHLPPPQVAIRFCVTWGLILSSMALTVKSYLGKKVRDILREG